MALVFDIETIGVDYEGLDEVARENLSGWIGRQNPGNLKIQKKALRDLKSGMCFSPLTGEIAVLGVYDTEVNKGVVYFQAPDLIIEEFSDEVFCYKAKTEKEMLQAFWKGVEEYEEFVSFNGRAFDVPFLMIRSAINEVKPSVNLMQDRYLNNNYLKAKHIDLLDQMSFYGAVRRKSSLHLYCNAFGIQSPKSKGITGEDVGGMFRDKKYKELAEYNSWDLIATSELYHRWKEYF